MLKVVMAISPARQLALDVLLAVDERGGYASDLLHSSTSRGRDLSPPDRRLATELVMGVLRWRAQLDGVLARGAHRPHARLAASVRAALRLGAYQLRFLDRIPPMAAVHESVEMVKASAPAATGFVNAMLRRAAREAGEPIEALLAAELDPIRRREIIFSHPAWLLDRWSRHYGVETADAIAEFNNRAPVAAVRPAGGAALADLAAGIQLRPGRLLRAAWRVASGDPTKSDAYRQGQLRLQDEASQLVAYLLEPSPRHRILDACAAPGGKTELIASLAPGASLVAVELHGQRARRLRLLLAAQTGVHVVGADASRPLPFRRQFDRILVDAPCTGTGTLARNPEIKWRLQPTDPARMAELQTTILRQSLAALAPGGRLVYSVCSIEPEEGPGVINAALAADSSLSLVPATNVLRSLSGAGHLALDPPPAAALTAGGFLRLLPGTMETDGFFAAILERAR